MMVDDLLHRELPRQVSNDVGAANSTAVPDASTASVASGASAADELLWLPAPESAKRARVQLHYDGHSIGCYERSSRRIVEVDACPIAVDEVSQAILQVKRLFEGEILLDAESDASKTILRLRNARHRGFTVDVRIELTAGTPAKEVFAVITGTLERETKSELGIQRRGVRRSASEIQHIEPIMLKIAGENAAGVMVCDASTGEDSISHYLSGVTIRHPVDGFFQVCPAWAYEAFGRVFNKWDLSGDTLFDLYGGCGFFSVLLRKRFKRFVIVDSDERAVEHAAMNLAAYDCSVETCDVPIWLERLTKRNTSVNGSRGGSGGSGRNAGGNGELTPAVRRPRIVRPSANVDIPSERDVVILDPPRAGLPETAVYALAARDARGLPAIGAGAIILVGCDGAVFMRDLKKLLLVFELKHLAAIDLFPMTTEVEFVGMLSRKPIDNDGI
jgi:tRNA/tmRNA/rRNA uracil-C5-methylase (TrmA/RlmC/RlmD family)